jgi:transglutaminase-like putative cysteine protease
VIPYTNSPEDKVNAILDWMEHGAARRTESSAYEPQYRDPEDTLNYQELLRVCGTATNAFVNLGSSGGLKTRRLLLLDSEGLNTNHVVAEVWLGERWIVVDPSFHTLFRDDAGRFLTREQLSMPTILTVPSVTSEGTTAHTIMSIQPTFT